MTDSTVQIISSFASFFIGGVIALPLYLQWRKKTLGAQRVVVSEVHAVEPPFATDTRVVLEPIRLYPTTSRNIIIACCAFAYPVGATYLIRSARPYFELIVHSLPQPAIYAIQIFLLVSFAVFTVGCLRMSAYYLSQLIASVPWIVLDDNGFAVDAYILRYSFDWSNLQSARIVEQGAFRRMEIVLKSVDPLYARKHSSILKREVQLNLKLRKSHLVIFGSPKAAKVQIVDLDQLLLFMANRINPEWDASKTNRPNLVSDPSGWPPPPTN